MLCTNPVSLLWAQHEVGRSKGEGPAPKYRLEYSMVLVDPIPVADPAHLVVTRHLLGAMPSGELGHSTLRTPPQDMQGKQLPFIPLPLSKSEADVTVPPVDSPG